MLLTPIQHDRYWSIVDALVAFAANRTGRLDELYPTNSLQPDDRVGAEVLDWIYGGHTEVIKEFVRKNPAHLKPGDLNDVRRWDQGLSSVFALDVDEQGETCLMVGGSAFVVRGCDYEPYELANGIPAIVHTVLVPFCGMIVHLPTFQTLDVKLDKDMVAAIRAMRLDAINDRRMARTGRDFLREAPKAAAELDSGMAPSLIGLQESDAYLQGLEDMPRGQHRGALAGLTWDERERRVDAYLRPRIAAHINHACAIFSKPASSLADLLQLETRARIETLASRYRVRGRSKMRKAELAKATAAAIIPNASSAVEDFLHTLKTVDQVARLRRLVEAGGREDVSARDDDAVGGLSRPYWPYVELFEHGGSMTAVLAQELLEAFGAVDWEAELARAKASEDMSGRHDGKPLATVTPQAYAETVVALRGVALLADTASAYLALPEDRRTGIAATTPGAVAQDLRQTDPETVDYDVITTSQGELLVESTLCADNYRTLTGHDIWEDSGDSYPGTQLAPFVVEIVSRHREIEPHLVSDDMLVGGGYFEWARTQPAALALTRYLDAHVPDDADDMLFADGIMEEIIDASHGGYAPQGIMEYLSMRGAITDERSTAAVAGLVMSALNDLPRWDNNGWSPRELLEGKNRPRA